MRYQPFLFLLLPFAAGILLQEYLNLSFYYFIFFIGLSLGVFLWCYYNKSVVSKLRTVFLCLVCFGTGGFLHFLNSNDEVDSVLDKKENLVFKIDKKLNSNEKNRRYEIIAEKNSQQFGVVLAVPKSQPELNFNSYYKASLYLNKVEAPHFDFQFNYSKYLARKGIFYQGYAFSKVEYLERNDLSWAEHIKQSRWNLLNKLDGLAISTQTREFIKGIILADRTEISKDVVSDFNRTGLVHILAISGSHMVILFFVFSLVFKFILGNKNRRLSIVLSLLFIWAFSIFIDYGSSVMRSCIMITIYYIYVLLQRQTSLLHSVGLSAILLLGWDTNQLFDVGFQLSFAAVLGIFWLNKPITNLFPNQVLSSKVSKFFISIFSITLAAQLATLPLVLFYFHQFSVISVLANLLVIPLAEILIIVALVVTVMVAIGIDFSLFYTAYDFAVQYVLKFIHYLAGWVDRDTFIGFNGLEVVVSFVVIFLLRFLLLKPNGSVICKFSGAALLFLFVSFGSDFYEYRKDEILEHSFYKQRIVSIKRGDFAVFLVGRNSDKDKVVDYIIKPYNSSRRISNYRVIAINDSKERFVNVEGKVFEIR